MLFYKTIPQFVTYICIRYPCSNATTHMSSKFFNNEEGNTLFEKLQGIAKGMKNFDRFLAVAGYFRSSGYFKLRKELGDVKEIKILVGINIDNIFRRHNKAMAFFADDKKAKEIYEKDFIQDIVDAHYSKEVEDGILRMLKDLKEGRLEMRIHATKKLHAKFYLCLPKNHNENTDGWVIMGSSNLSDSGLGITEAPRYELNVAMKDYDDVKYCADEFDKLWEESVKLSPEDIEKYKSETYLGYQPTPYELYIKVLIDYFGPQVEDEFDMQLPEGVLDLKYQRDAVIQGYQMMMEHNGFFLADVVGLGKTMIATMIAKRFIEANGSHTNVLVVYPPSVEKNWKETFKLFGIYKKAQFITNGSLSKINEGKDQYKEKEEFDLIIVDEAHGFRKDETDKYGELERICKASRNEGMVTGTSKKVMLLSATPLNNTPEDLRNLLLLFQNGRECTIDGIPNIMDFFSQKIEKYKELMRARNNKERDVTAEVEEIYKDIREKVIDKVTVRRTRNNIINDEDYREDLKKQGIVFPKIEPPHELKYTMNEETSQRFYNTLATLTRDENSENDHLFYARYRAIEFLKPERKKGKNYKNAEHTAQMLAEIYRVHMVKRLESSFHAFKLSLATLLRITTDMIKMFSEDKVIIAADINVKELQAKGMELDEIIEYAAKKGHDEDEITFKAEDFDPKFLEMLNNDKTVLERLNANWEQEKSDPKFDVFREYMNTEFFRTDMNKEGKLVVFSESVDTLNYLNKRLTEEMGKKDVLMVSAANRDKKEKTIQENFDANHGEKRNDYNILLTSDVLAEGINLHRSNVIINYDSPWNATKLIQRIGRVNRIGSTAGTIYNYLFYPSQQGDNQIQLYKNALIKLQGFHSAFGEDAQIYSKEEIVKQFKLYDNTIRDNTDKKIKLLREVRDLYNHDQELYHKIKRLPMKSRIMRSIGKHSGKTVVFVKSDVKTEFYLADDSHVKPIDFLDAIGYLKANNDEKPAPFSDETRHYEHVNKALNAYRTEYTKAADTDSINNLANNKDRQSQRATKFLRDLHRISKDTLLKKGCEQLLSLIDRGVYQQLPKKVVAIASKYKNNRQGIINDEYEIQARITDLLREFSSQPKSAENTNRGLSDPTIIISETFK